MAGHVLGMRGVGRDRVVNPRHRQSARGVGGFVIGMNQIVSCARVARWALKTGVQHRRSPHICLGIASAVAPTHSRESIEDASFGDRADIF